MYTTYWVRYTRLVRTEPAYVFRSRKLFQTPPYGRVLRTTKARTSSFYPLRAQLACPTALQRSDSGSSSPCPPRFAIRCVVKNGHETPSCRVVDTPISVACQVRLCSYIVPHACKIDTIQLATQLAKGRVYGASAFVEVSIRSASR